MFEATALRRIQKVLGYRFKDKELLSLALTHRSYAHEQGDRGHGDNERLELLGDAVLDLAITHMLIQRFPDHHEGVLSKMRAGIVNEARLVEVAQRLKLGRYIRLGKGELATGGRSKPSILADAVEALLAAVYLDGGWDAAFNLVRQLFRPYFDSDLLHSEKLHHLDKDFKTRLQEWTQSRFKRTPVYEILMERGPDHDKEFQVRVRLGSEVLGNGWGKSKKAAQQNAACQALKRLGVISSEGPLT